MLLFNTRIHHTFHILNHPSEKIAVSSVFECYNNLCHNLLRICYKVKTNISIRKLIIAK